MELIRSHSRVRSSLTPRVALRRILIGLVLVVGLASACQGYDTRHVVLIIIDGLRYSEGLGDSSHKYVPEMYRLSKEGTIIEPFLNDRYTNTARAIPAIWCGAWAEMRSFKGSGCDGGEYQYCALPTMFEYYRKQCSTGEDDCMYVLRGIDRPWKPSLDPDYGPKHWPRYVSEGSSDLDVWHQAEKALKASHPSLFVLYLERVDHFAHTKSWSYYTRSIQLADSIVGLVWDFLQADSVYAGSTTLLVTNDHGRHTDDFSGHDCDCQGCRTVELLAVGPDIKPGFVSNVPRTICDITPTIGELLGFVAEKSTGAVMYELFTAPAKRD